MNNQSAYTREVKIMNRKSFFTILITGTIAFTGIVPVVPAFAKTADTTPKYTYQLKNDPQYDSLYTKNQKQQLIGVTYDQLGTVTRTDPDTGVKEDAATAIDKALSTVNNEVAKDDRPFVKDNTKQARKDYKANKKTFAPYVCTDDLTPVRADDHTLTVRRDRYIDQNGAHGLETVTAYSFDGATGKRLSLTDVMKYKSNDNLSGIIAKEVLKKYGKTVLSTNEKSLKKKIKALFNSKYYTGSNDTKALTWYVDRGGITFFFNTDDIAPYAAGTFSIKLTAKKYPEINTYYTKAPKNYTRKVNAYSDSVDGKKLTISGHPDEYDTYNSLKVKYGKKSVTFTPYIYSFEPVLVVTSNKKYLYVNTHEENDYQSIYVIDLGAKKLRAKAVDLGFYGTILTDPDNMLLMTRGDILSTVTLSRTYSTGKSGIPAANNRYFLVNSSPTLTLKKNVTLDVLDSYTSETTHAKEFAKGTKLTIFRTDNKTTADCLTTDGDLIRLTVDQNAYPQKINGKYTEDELLEGAMFAG